jgi:acetylglutamate kinase
MRVVKVGGHDLADAGFVRGLAGALLSAGRPAVVVHGGGREVDQLMHRLGLSPTRVEGLRRTDRETLEAVLMVLCGSVRNRLVAALVSGGVDALGLSGVDGGLVRCRPLRRDGVDLGLVGEVESVRVPLLRRLLDDGLTPVLSPVCLGHDGRIYNVNADDVATAVALALAASRLDFVSNVPGVLDGGEVVAELPAEGVEARIAAGVIGGGMVPKVRAAAAAAAAGVPLVRIVGLAQLGGDGGTTVTSRAVDAALAPASGRDRL